jgi:hypothetical protein
MIGRVSLISGPAYGPAPPSGSLPEGRSTPSRPRPGALGTVTGL